MNQLEIVKMTQLTWSCDTSIKYNVSTIRFVYHCCAKNRLYLSR